MYTGLSSRTRRLLCRVTQVASLPWTPIQGATYAGDQPMPTDFSVLPSRLVTFSAPFNSCDGKYLQKVYPKTVASGHTFSSSAAQAARFPKARCR